MPSKYWINIALLVLSATAWSARGTSDGLADRDEERRGAACDGYAAPRTLSLGHLCVVSFDAPTEAPVYRAAVEDRSYRFLFNAVGMALLVDVALWAKLEAGATPLREQLLSDLGPERLALWHQDALYWARWLEMSEEQWGGRP